MGAILQYLFFAVVIRPLVLVIIGLNIRNRNHLPQSGPAILVANHNSHLDTLVLMTLFPMSMLRNIRPVAAADYFLSSGIKAWFSKTIMRIIPIRRRKSEGAQDDPLAPISEALKNQQIVIFFPEGTRGEAERMTQFKSGIARLAERHPEIPVVPIFLNGLGKALPKGEGILVPFFCDVFIGEPVTWSKLAPHFLPNLEAAVHELSKECHHTAWE